VTTVVLGGGLAAAFHHLAPAVQRVLAERTSLTGEVSVVPGRLGSRAGSLGAALYARDRSRDADTSSDPHDESDA
jgi:predicted NBD/HSP70 family sugar kinase